MYFLQQWLSLLEYVHGSYYREPTSQGWCLKHLLEEGPERAASTSATSTSHQPEQLPFSLFSVRFRFHGKKNFENHSCSGYLTQVYRSPR